MSNSRTRAPHCWYASALGMGPPPQRLMLRPFLWCVVVCGCVGIVLRGCFQALKHLDGLEVDGSTMMVKVPSATSKRLEEYKAALDERHKQQLEEAKRQAQTRAAVAAVQKLQGGAAPVDEPGEVPEKVLAPFEQEEVACTSAIDEALSAFTVRKKEEAEQARLDAEFEAADRALIGEESKGRGGDISDPNRGKHILTEIEKFRLQEVCGCGCGCGCVCGFVHMALPVRGQRCHSHDAALLVRGGGARNNASTTWRGRRQRRRRGCWRWHAPSRTPKKRPGERQKPLKIARRRAARTARVKRMARMAAVTGRPAMITGDPVAATAVPAVALATGTAVALALALAHTIAVASTAGVTGLGRPAPGRVIATVDTATATTGTTATAVGTVVGRRLAPGRGLQSSAAGGVMTTRVARLRLRQLLWSR